MSWSPALDPTIPMGTDIDAIETILIPRARDLGGFEVRRALPSVDRQMIGPFIFFDQFGPTEFLTGAGIDVRPHPHIGLGTVTYLLNGRIHHRDSLGTDQWIEPGAVNWMLAGNGITHSERMDDPAKHVPNLFGVQTWLALPEDLEDTPADFTHLPKSHLPVLTGEGKELRLILGNAYGERVPLDMPSNMFYADAILAPGAAIPMPDDHEDRGLFVLSGDVTVAGQNFAAGRMLVFRPGDAISAKAGDQGARLLLLGGDTLNGPRHIWWNFVASSREKINAAKEAWRAGDWAHGRFKLPPGDDAEFILAP